MKRALFLTLFCLCLTLPALAEEDSFWTEGTLDCNGHTVTIHALVHDELPEQLQQITLKGKKVTQAAFEEALGHHFTLAENFGKRNGKIPGFDSFGDFYLSEWAPECSGIVGYKSLTCYRLDTLHPVKDETLRTLYDQCAAFLEELGYTAALDAGYICRWNFDVREMDAQGEHIIVLLPFEFEGLATEYESQIVNRSSLETTKKSSGSIMDYPWADFVFDSSLQLVNARMSTYQIGASKPLSGVPLSWEEAAQPALEYLVCQVVSGCQEMPYAFSEPDPSYDENRFWEDFSVKLVRALPMWMPNWSNVCMPGWCIQYELYRRDTGDLFTSFSFGVDIFTGEVAAYQAK